MSRSLEEIHMPAVTRVLVVGAGVSGTAAAILLAEKGVSVELIEQKPAVTVLGSGITLMGNALRVLRDLGVWNEVLAHGYGFATTGIRLPNDDATIVAEIPNAQTGGPDLPATLGMPRPELARILLDRAASLGVDIRFGTELASFTQSDVDVETVFADGSVGRYDLVIGADGVKSTTRRLLDIDEEPTPTGMAIWRVFAPRPPSIERTDLTYGGPAYIAGYCPTGTNSLYAYIVEDADSANFALNNAERAEKMRALAENYHGPWDDLRPHITADSPVNYTFFESHFVEGPWNRGRVVIIGDAAHSCPPTLAQGAAQGLEDAVVLAELLVSSRKVDDELWSSFTARRSPRTRRVVDASKQLVTWLLEHDPNADVPGLMAGVSAMVSERP